MLTTIDILIESLDITKVFATIDDVTPVYYVGQLFYATSEEVFIMGTVRSKNPSESGKGSRFMRISHYDVHRQFMERYFKHFKWT